MLSRRRGRCSHFAPTRGPPGPHGDEPGARATGRLPEHELIELPGFGLMHLGHEMPVAVERRLDRRVPQLRLDVLRPRLVAVKAVLDPFQRGSTR